jgi:Alginate lyase
MICREWRNLLDAFGRGASALLCLALSGFAFADATLSAASANATGVIKTPTDNVKLELISLKLSALESSRTKIRAGDAALKPSYAALLKRADKALSAPPRSVTEKTLVPVGGSKHDYMSMGPYWWPNPDTVSGLPYVRRDGIRNPEVTSEALDAGRLVAMNRDARDLALAYYFTNDMRYASRCAEVLRTWFLQPSTKMNPNMRFAQSIPGIVDGRGIGLIDARDFWMSIDAALLIAPSGKFSSAELEQLRQWFADFARWMSDSEIGLEEAAAYNNHGIFYDAQISTYWRFTNEFAKARRVVFNAITLRVASQVNRNGDLPQELERTRPYHYTAFALEAAMQLAQHAEALDASANAAEAGIQTAERLPANDNQCQHRQIRCPLDFFNANLDGRSIKRAIGNLGRVIIEPNTWTHRTTVEPNPPLRQALVPLLMSQQIGRDAQVMKALSTLKASREFEDDVAWLMWPVN